MQIVIYEDGRERDFGPLTLLRPVFDLRCGALLLREKVERRAASEQVVLFPRAELAEAVEEECPGRGAAAVSEDRTLFLSARVVADDDLFGSVRRLSGESLLTSAGGMVGAFVERRVAERATALLRAGGDVSALGVGRETQVPARLVDYPWDLVRLCREEIGRDVQVLGCLGVNEATVLPGAHLLEPERISLGPGSEVGPGAVLDARHGEILVGRDVVVMPNAYVQGPAAIGDGSIVKVGAKLYAGTSIGPVCKVGGEVESSIFQSYSNKQHDGFLGHSYVASWVNLGAATDNSDLKNNYSRVRVEMAGELVDTGLLLVGATIGDHSKTAIGTKLTTGAVVGVFSSVLGARFAPKSIPSFSWDTGEGLVEHDLEKAIETARRAMARRGVTLSPVREALVRQVYDKTRSERARVRGS